MYRRATIKDDGSILEKYQILWLYNEKFLNKNSFSSNRFSYDYEKTQWE